VRSRHQRAAHGTAAARPPNPAEPSIYPSRRDLVSPLLATHPKNAPLTPIIATLPKTRPSKSFACRTYKNNPGGVKALLLATRVSRKHHPLSPSWPETNAVRGRLESKLREPLVSPLKSILTETRPRNSFAISTYANHRGRGRLSQSPQLRARNLHARIFHCRRNQRISRPSRASGKLFLRLYRSSGLWSSDLSLIRS
jgi:hypothetical protein